ncbi:MAG: hypothetical protein GX464_08475 [Holophagae bacterium]|nr:hypothetical protein [Holophagae bacterium]
MLSRPVLCASLVAALTAPVGRAAAPPPGPVLTIRLSAPEIVAGEPLWAWAELYNPGSKEIVAMSLCPSLGWYVVAPGVVPSVTTSTSEIFWPASPPKELEALRPGARVNARAASAEIASPELREVGEHDVIGEIKYPEWPWTPPAPDGYLSGVLRSVPVRVVVKEPQGVDREAFEAYGGQPLELGQEELLVKFPTSTYSGYQLLYASGLPHGPLGLIRSRDDWERKIQRVMPSARDEIRAWRDKEEARARDQMTSVEVFLSAHPSFALGGWLRLQKASLLAYFGRYEDARFLTKQVIAEEKDSDKGKEAKAFLAYLAEKGYLKPE